MTRALSRPGALWRGALLASSLAGAAAAQPAGPLTASLDGPEPRAGVGVPLRVRLSASDAATQGGLASADGRAGRVRDLRLVSPEGASLPVQLDRPWRDGEPLLLRGDLPLAGSWTLSFTLLRPGGRPVPVALAFTVDAGAPVAAPFEPAPPALAAGDVAASSGPAAATAAGPQPPAGPR